MADEFVVRTIRCRVVSILATWNMRNKHGKLTGTHHGRGGASYLHESLCIRRHKRLTRCQLGKNARSTRSISSLTAGGDRGQDTDGEPRGETRTLIRVQRGEVPVMPCMRSYLMAHVVRVFNTLGKSSVVDTAPCICH